MYVVEEYVKVGGIPDMDEVVVVVVVVEWG